MASPVKDEVAGGGGGGSHEGLLCGHTPPESKPLYTQSFRSLAMLRIAPMSLMTSYFKRHTPAVRGKLYN